MASTLLPFILTVLVAATHEVRAECPNACSGHGFCLINDACQCFRGWMATDCSERICPYGHAFTTTPQGDLNLDGDRDDNTGKRLSQTIKSFPLGSNRIIFWNSLVIGELRVGDSFESPKKRSLWQACIT